MDPAVIGEILVRGLPQDAEDRLRLALRRHVGERLTEERFTEIRNVAADAGEGVRIQINPDRRKNRLVSVVIFDPESAPKRIAVAAEDQRLLLRCHMKPRAEQPATVQVEVIIGRNGAVLAARAVDGPEHLAEAAIATASRWLYRPRLLNGIPVEVQTTVEVRFVRSKNSRKAKPAIRSAKPLQALSASHSVPGTVSPGS